MQIKDRTPWEWSSAWKTKAQYFSWLRGQIRQIWSAYPVRTEWKNSMLRPVTPEERKQKIFHPSTKKVGQCVFCQEWFAGSKLEVDHIEETDGCYSFETAEKFLWRMAAEPTENMALVCKPCHKVKSYAERQGISFEEARVQKAVIAKEKELGKRAKKFLLDKGYSEDETSNSAKRRSCLEKLIREEIDNE